MSETKHAATRPAKRQPRKPAANKTVAPLPEKPVVAPEPVPMPATETVKKVKAKKTPEVLHRTPMGFISAARVRTNMDKLTLNKAVNEESKPMRQALNQLETAETRLKNGGYTEGETFVPLTAELTKQYNDTVATVGPKKMEYTLKLDALARERVRFSNNAPDVLSVVCGELINQLVTHTVDNAISLDKKIIKVSHLHSDSVSKLSLYPLIRNLPSFMAYERKFASENSSVQLDKMRKELKDKLWRDFRARYNKASLVKEKKVDPAPLSAPVTEDHAEEVVEEEVDESTDGKTSFKFYVVQECKYVIGLDKYKEKGVRISTEIKDYLSDLLIEFIQRVAFLVQRTAEAMTRKTINKTAIMKTVEKLLIDGHTPTEAISYVSTQVPDPALYDAEVKKRNDAKAAGTVYKINLESIPKVQGYTVVKTVTYPDVEFKMLEEKVNAALVFSATPAVAANTTA